MAGYGACVSYCLLFILWGFKMSSTQLILTADTIPLVALDFMNNTHFEELELLASLGELINSYQEHDNERDEITQSLDDWLSHTKAHFDRENELMIDINFPMFPMHSGEHRRVLDEMEQIVLTWKEKNEINILADYVFSIWPRWFEAHVNSMDMITAQFAVMNGYEPE